MMLFIDKDYAGGDDDEISEEYQEHRRYVFSGTWRQHGGSVVKWVWLFTGT